MNNPLIAVLKAVAANALQATAIATALMLITIPGIALATTQCVLPVADGGDIPPSPPSVTGKIVEIHDHQLTVEIRKGVVHRTIVNDGTGLWTVFGGGIEETDLKVGQHVLIWLQDCRHAEKTPQVAAVVQVCSLAAEACAER
ncbi:MULTISPECIES: hypothetical protein [Stenotrophomonas]|uniref:hypothetical protein n=1 Tax=Stenotrophomonas TaxID=40323 RepID=UPI000B6A77BD|nr:MULTISPECIES: hypothetical protein [Stenotrophomonas]SMR76804.1 hypothetical protein SAMN04487863_2384 [Stenotrophomonas sp. yr243]SNS75839.1 hypothetical protein SAMN05518671_1852 [Stenotrophomonas lactitubi]